MRPIAMLVLSSQRVLSDLRAGHQGDAATTPAGLCVACLANHYDRYRKGSAIMHPLLTVAAGLVVGAVGVRLAKSVKTREALKSSAATGLETARSGLSQARGAALSGLSVIERSSAGLRRKLETPSDSTEVVDPPASGPKRKKAASRTRAGGTSRSSSKTKPGQAPE